MDETTLRRILREEISRAVAMLQNPNSVSRREDGTNEYLTADEAAAIAKVHFHTITNALRDTTLHGTQRVRRGKWTVRRDCLEAWLEKKHCSHGATKLSR